jgi:hypothetical protein
MQPFVVFRPRRTASDPGGRARSAKGRRDRRGCFTRTRQARHGNDPIDFARWLEVRLARRSGGLKLHVNAPADRCGDIDERIQ